MITDEERLQSRAEFYLCLSQAFLTPASEEAWGALQEALADDLDDIDGVIGYDIAEHVARYRMAIAGIADQPALLQIYSGLFLAPPRHVSINTGSYLDGAMNGGSVLAMEEAYRQAGLARDEQFHDLSDHLSIQLEFVASRYLACLAQQDYACSDAAAGSFLDRFLRPALPALIADLETASQTPNPWLPLARLLHVAVVHDARGDLRPREHQRLDTALTKARHDRAQHGVTAADMAFIAQRLQDKGLATDHLAIAPELRDEAQGWSRKVPPSPRRGSRLG